jgi:hypothetical protein
MVASAHYRNRVLPKRLKRLGHHDAAGGLTVVFMGA